MTCGFRVVYGYTQSDEISLLLHRDDATFGRKLRKLESVLAGEASAKFSLLLGDLGTFDCRICQLPNQGLVVDYFRWRSEDAHCNALNAHCYWALRNQGASAGTATGQLAGMSVADKNQLLFELGCNVNDLPAWQKRGTGLYWETYTREAIDPRTGAPTNAVRRRIRRELELPMKSDHETFIERLLADATGSP